MAMRQRFIKVIDKYGLMELLGQGMYGRVYKGVNTQTNEDVAVKVIHSDKFVQNPQLQQYTVNEIRVLNQLGETPHIIRYVDMLKTINNYYFIYEYCNGGTLGRQISMARNTPQKVIPISKTMAYFGEIISAFKILTRNKIMHRDLKPDNILLHNGRIKIGDFGFSKSLKSPTDLAKTMLGSPIYMGPEVLKGQAYTMKADIWSLGVVLYEMVFGVCPFQSEHIGKLIQILEVEQVKYPKTIPSSVQNLLRRMLVKDPSKRIDWVDLFQFKVTESGQVIQPPARNYKNTSRGLGVTNGFGSTLQVLTGSSTTDSSNNRKSPLPIQRESKNYTSNISSTRTDNKFSVTTNPKDVLSQLNQLSKNHEKVVQAVNLAIQVLRRSPKQSFGLSHIINKMAYKELNTILDFLNKNWLNNSSVDLEKNDQGIIVRFKEMVIDELIQLDSSLKVSKDILQSLQGDSNTIEFRRNRLLKGFLKAYRPSLEEDEQAVVLMSQMIDYFEDSILLKKDTYKRVSKLELLKQISTKINKLQ